MWHATHTEKPTSPDNTKCTPHLVLTQWIPHSKINLQLESHFLLSAAEEVSPSCLFAWWLDNEGLVRRLTLTAQPFRSLCQNIAPGKIWVASCPQEQFYHGYVSHFPLLCLPAGYMSNYCMRQATFSLTLVNNREGIHIKCINIHKLCSLEYKYWSTCMIPLRESLGIFYIFL